VSTDLTLALVSTIRHDGHGGVADDLADPAGLASWTAGRAGLLRAAGVEPVVADETLRAEVVEVRRAVRALCAEAVRPGPPSRADATTLLPAAAAVDRLNRAAGRVPVHPVLTWPADGEPEMSLVAGPAGPRVRLPAALATAAITFLTGPDRTRLRACPAPRCVRYFVQDHARQQWCKPSCGNRARVARHYQRRQAGG
jgi:predicted RNA-binding Zn ribbon-like protein